MGRGLGLLLSPAPYGYCYYCGLPVRDRTRGVPSMDICPRGHTYDAKYSLRSPSLVHTEQAIITPMTEAEVTQVAEAAEVDTGQTFDRHTVARLLATIEDLRCQNASPKSPPTSARIALKPSTPSLSRQERRKLEREQKKRR